MSKSINKIWMSLFKKKHCRVKHGQDLVIYSITYILLISIDVFCK